MPKNILIFSDGTGQIGGVRPDQRLSNVYKMYRAMRPGPDSPIKPSEQVCFYDAGLGAGEVDGQLFKRTQNFLSAAVGTGIDKNVIDCYEKIISYYEPDDRIILIGFSRGAYTVRALANVMNLCGIPTQMPDGKPIPRYGKHLRKIASDAVNYVYNHGNGYPRCKEHPYHKNREELGKRFRKKYSSQIPNISEQNDVQGNVQPSFIGVFDTVAALGNKIVGRIMEGAIIGLLVLISIFWIYDVAVCWIIAVSLPFITAAYWRLKLLKSQFKYFSPDANKPLKLNNPFHWPTIARNFHFAVWNMEHYDRWLDSDVLHARHAMAIDEHREKFPRVKWATRKEAQKASEKRREAGQPEWLKQIWFPGCHSDIGGSYPEDESRLSDIALDWMINELKECIPEIQINEDLLVRSPDATALQHEERYAFEFGFIKIRWGKKPRMLKKDFPLHPSVFARFEAENVQQLDDLKPYRPEQLRYHQDLQHYTFD